MEKQVYTTRELAEKAEVTQAYIRQLCIAGRIKAEKIGRDWIISAREALKFLNRNK